ncbi:DUF1622 domain-containing protein [Rhodobacter sp. CZR27]|uniref:DUF1622 domain-containing protein n=1 Tax=Rhodobacter sp. CZR27 TaxID=2033869 RepID=UPI000BBF138F|nr:DUF1622 domain-containing protein [Rhodobacter sp. CZR27]
MTAEEFREGLVVATDLTVLAIDVMVLGLVLAGTIQTFVAGAGVFLSRTARDTESRGVWLRYGRVLVAALTFQLAADIIETATTTDWEDVARLGLVAVIRTFLNYFLERDLSDLRERQREGP